MNCEEVAALLSADVDGEVDRLRSHAMARHVAGCAACTQRYHAALAQKARLRAELPYHRASAALRARVQAAQTPGLEPRMQPGLHALEGRWRWFGGGLLTGGLAAGLLWAAAMLWQHQLSGADLSGQVVGLHTRATLGNHLIDVASSDRHTVRPWLSARLDYAVPVTDWAVAGYALMGARVDHLEGQPVATLVYRHRNHVIDVFVRPATPGAAATPTHTVRGFNVAAAVGADMQWVATSDLNSADLTEFAKGLAKGSVNAAGD